MILVQASSFTNDSKVFVLLLSKLKYIHAEVLYSSSLLDSQRLFQREYQRHRLFFFWHLYSPPMVKYFLVTRWLLTLRDGVRQQSSATELGVDALFTLNALAEGLATKI